MNTISLELWQLVTLILTIIGGFWTLARLLLQGAEKSIDEKFKAMAEHMKGQDDSNRRVERDLMELKAELPRDYVRREDYTQAIAMIMTKIDAMALRVEQSFRDLMNKGGRND